MKKNRKRISQGGRGIFLYASDLEDGINVIMRGLYLINGNHHKVNATGIYKKITAQIGIFNKYNLCCQEYILHENRSANSIIAAIIHRLPFTNTTPKWKYDDAFADLDFLYFRRPSVMTIAMRRFLKKVKKINPNIKIMMELPTFPYDHELSGVANYSLLLKDKYNRRKLSGLVDRIVVIDPTMSINQLWDIDTIPIINGIEMASIAERHPKAHNGINMLCIAYFSPWHGYERLIEGVHNYYVDGGTRNIIIHFVGEGDEEQKYKSLVEKYNLFGNVIFHGKKTGKELDDLYDIADFGVVGLNWYKYGYKIIGDLKSREYLAKGIPLINSGKVDVELVSETDFIYDEEPDGRPINIQNVISTYDKIYNSSEQSESIVNKIRIYSEKIIDMKNVMKDIIKYLKE